jgi:hypothetical protein
VFVPRQSGTVVPNYAMTGVTVNQSFVIQTPDVQRFRRSESQIMADAARMTQLALRRNG